jgi:hypothetical protein
VTNSLTLTGDLDVNAGVLTLPITGTGAGNVTINGGLLQTQLTSNGVGTGPVTINNAGKVQVLGNGLTTNAITVNHTGLLSVSGSVASSTGVTLNDTGRYEAVNAQTVKALTVNGGQAKVLASATKIALTVGDGTQTASPLSLTGGTLDLTTNGVAVDYAATDAAGDGAMVASVRGQIIAGFGANKDWLGSNGITSANAAADKSAKAIGYALATEVLPFANGATTDTFMGSTVDKSTAVARYTLAGDATLDGTVDFNDLVKLAQNYNTTVSDVTQSWWNKGDFTYDGITDFNDLVKLAQNYNTSLPSAPIPGASIGFEADLARAFASVPEPGTLSVLAIGALALLGRRRGRRAMAA